ncbi:MAG: quorum-sensing autoinducer synthase [Gammaproteobacteria bacterium]|nr:quorum-sensing autoinducer synthase [Gammaproteobacteria bacterium]
MTSINMAPLFAKANQHAYQKRERAFYTDRIQKSWGGGHIMKGRIPNDSSLVLMSNDYLSLANDERIRKIQADTLMNTGNGLIMSSVFLHGENPQGQLERRFAIFLQSESTVLCQSGWAANVGLLQTIADSTTPVYIDMHAHMSLWEGIKSAGATAHGFRHNNISHIERQIRKHGQGIIVVDSIYSTNGSICPLHDLVNVGELYNCLMVVDESHSLGTHGYQGEGLVASLGLTHRVHFRTASLAKAFAGRVGIITCSSKFYEYFKCNSFPAIFSSSLLLHEIAALSQTLDIVIASNKERERLHRNADVLRTGLIELGYNVSVSQSQIIPLEAGPEQRTIKLRDALEAHDIFGAVFCAPATAKNRSMIRLSLNAALSATQIQYTLEVLHKIRDKVDLDQWPSTSKLVRSNVVSL